MPTNDLDQSIGMQVVIMSLSGSLVPLWLPPSPQGRYYFEGLEEIKTDVCIEASGGKWVIRCKRPMVIDLPDGKATCCNLEDKQLVHIEKPGWYGAIYAEKINRENQTFRNYYIRANRISIGRLAENDIVCSSPFTSRCHAVLEKSGGKWLVKDNKSANHVYVNGRCVREAPLVPGDEIFIMGVRIIMGVGFLSINDGAGRAKLNPITLVAVDEMASARPENAPEGMWGEEAPFNRLPRRRRALEVTDIEIEGPPMALNGDKMPLLLRMGGSITMAGAAAMMGHFTMLLASVLFPLLGQGYTEKDRKEYENRRVASYTAYLNEARNKIDEETRREMGVLTSNYPETARVLSYTDRTEQLWERRTTDDDFLEIRLGSGRVPLKAELIYPKKRFDIDSDPLEDKMYDIAERKYFLEKVPIMTSLVENHVCGITGSASARFEFAQMLLMQIAVLHSYDEVKIVVLADEKTLEGMSYVRYLPHTWDDQRNIRFIATDTGSAYQVGEHLKQQLGPDLEKPRDLKSILRERPYYVVFAFDKKVFDCMEVLKEAMRSETTCGISIITVFDELPKETYQLFNVRSGNDATLTYLKDIEHEQDAFVPDRVDRRRMLNSARVLANTELRVIQEANALPNTVAFLETYGVGRVEDLNPAKRWAESDPVVSLAAPVGIASDGSVFMLDLHEKHEGPHGLIAGMTGSGKSEFILAYILSMAVNYHPDEVAFVLIDYKGGGLAGAFADEKQGIHLPHVVGTITNLDGAAIQRSLISLESELRRRQRIFNEAKAVGNTGTMDIYKYQRLYRQGKVSEPLPHLFVVSDEFAELKQQQPEFMSQLISTARIGRSLGVHLILATQKPAGVVNDQILSNTKFRICLKVQDRADSMDMLKRPEAAELTQIGRFYLQVGYNEYFALGQSAYSGAPYVPSDRVKVQHDETVRLVDVTGHAVSEVKPKPRNIGTGKSELVEVVQMLTDLAASMGVAPRQLWKEPLPNSIDAESLNGAPQDGQASEEIPGRLTACIGFVDDVQNQRQLPLTIDFGSTRNMLVVGSVQSGKSTIMQTMLFTLAKKYSPERVNFYVLDFSNGILADAGKLPHCGAALGPDDVDKLDGFFDLIHGIVLERKQLFEQLNVTSFEDAVRIQQIPLVLVFIDNLVGLTLTKVGRAHHDVIHEYMKEGYSYGVKYVVSCGDLTTESTQRIRQQLGERICLHVGDKYGYGEVLNKRCSYVPPDRPGRGMYVYEDEPLEIQVARIFSTLEGRERNDQIGMLCEQLSTRFAGQRSVVSLPSIPEAEEYCDFANRFELGRFPLGYVLDNAKPVSIPLRQMPMLSVYFGNPAGVKPVWENFMFAAQRESMDVTVMRAERNSVFSKESNCQLLEPTTENITLLCQTIVNEMNARLPLLEEYCNEHGLDVGGEDLGVGALKYVCAKVPPKLIVFERFADVSANVDVAIVDAFEKVFPLAKKYGIFFLAGFYPEDDVSRNPLFKAYGPNGPSMLFGGRQDRQQLFKIPYGHTIQTQLAEYNKALMQYREGLYELIMPCGQLSEVDEDPDDADIFG